MRRKRKCSFGQDRVIGYVVKCKADRGNVTCNFEFVTDANVRVSECGEFRAASDGMGSKREIEQAITENRTVEIDGKTLLPVKITRVLTSTPYHHSSDQYMPDCCELILKPQVGSQKLVKMQKVTCGARTFAASCKQHDEYKSFLAKTSKGESGEITLRDHGAMLISKKGKLSAKVKCDLRSGWGKDGTHTSVFSGMLDSGKPYAINDDGTRLPVFLESYYCEIEPTQVDLKSMHHDTIGYLNKLNVTVDELIKRAAELGEKHDKAEFCAWLKHSKVYQEELIETFCALPVKSAMSIVLADRLGRLYVDADIEIVRSVDIETWSAASAASAARFGRFV